MQRVSDTCALIQDTGRESQDVGWLQQASGCQETHAAWAAGHCSGARWAMHVHMQPFGASLRLNR